MAATDQRASKLALWLFGLVMGALAPQFLPANMVPEELQGFYWVLPVVFVVLVLAARPQGVLSRENLRGRRITLLLPFAGVVTFIVGSTWALTGTARPPIVVSALTVTSLYASAAILLHQAIPTMGLSEKRWVVWPDTPGRPGEEGRVS